MERESLILKIFGTASYGFDARELWIANKILDYFTHRPEIGLEISRQEQEVLDACRYALEREGASWESVMLNRTRKKEVVGYRDAIISIFWERVYGTQSRKTRILGGILTRATVLHAISSASDWKKYDPSFKALYKRLLKSVNEYLKNN